MTGSTRAALLASVCGLTMIAGSLALAQTPPIDAAAIFSLQGENSSISSGKVTDRYYTNGIHVGWTSPEGYLPEIAGLGRTVMGEGAQRVSISVSQQIYTPFDTQSLKPSGSDRPYAGVLLVNLSQSVETATSRGTVAINLGMLGPSALGKEVQNGFHDLIGQKGNKGWATQLRDEPVFDITSARVWRVSTGTLFGLTTDLLPAAALSLGTLRMAFDTGFNLRIGEGLDADFGAPRIAALSGGDAFRGGDGIGWYVFAGAAGHVVGRDVTLDGNNFTKTSRSVKLNPLVGDLDLGAALLVSGMRLSYTHVLQSQEFKKQKGGLHQFGSLALSVRF